MIPSQNVSGNVLDGASVQLNLGAVTGNTRPGPGGSVVTCVNITDLPDTNGSGRPYKLKALRQIQTGSGMFLAIVAHKSAKLCANWPSSTESKATKLTAPK